MMILKNVEIFLLAFNNPRPPLSVQKNFSPIGPAVWPAIDNIFIYECLVLLCRLTQNVLRF